MLYKIVKAKISSPACLNKGFILDGFPRKSEDAVQIFLESQDGEISEAQ
jgi:adenylate kinase family enzyme